MSILLCNHYNNRESIVFCRKLVSRIRVTLGVQHAPTFCEVPGSMPMWINLDGSGSTITRLIWFVMFWSYFFRFTSFWKNLIVKYPYGNSLFSSYMHKIAKSIVCDFYGHNCALNFLRSFDIFQLEKFFFFRIVERLTSTNQSSGVPKLILFRD